MEHSDPRDRLRKGDGIIGYPPGVRILSNVLKSLGWPGFALRMPRNLKKTEFVAAMRENTHKPLLPHQDGLRAGNAECSDGKDVKIFDFPTSRWHGLDRVRCVETGCMTVTR
jgi:hypothetical protein